MPSALQARVLYLAGNTREVRFVSGAFDVAFPGLSFEFVESAAESTARLDLVDGVDVVVLGWSLPEQDALVLLQRLRAEQARLPVIVAGEGALDVFRSAGADECVSRGSLFVTQLPRAIEEVLTRRAAASSTSQPLQDGETAPAPEPTLPAAPETPSVSVGLFGLAALTIEAGDRHGLSFVPLSEMADAAHHAVVLVDYGDSSLEPQGFVAGVRALTPSPAVVLLVSPSVARLAIDSLGGVVDDVHVQSGDWVADLAPRVLAAKARATRLREADALKAREGRLRTLIDILPASVVRMNAAGVVLALNPVAQSLLGATDPRALLRKPFEGFIAPADHEGWREALTRLSAGDRHRSLEMQVVTRTGESRAVEAMLASFPTVPGEAPAIAMVLRDVTNRKRLEAALEQLSLASPPLTEATVPHTALHVPEVPSTPDAVSPPDEWSAAGSVAPAVEQRPDSPAGIAPVGLDTLHQMESELQAVSARAQVAFQSLESAIKEAQDRHVALESQRQAERARLDASEGTRWQSFDAFIGRAMWPVAYTDVEGRLQWVNTGLATLLGYPSADDLMIHVPGLVDICCDPELPSALTRWWNAESTAPLDVRVTRRRHGPAVVRLHGARVGGVDGPQDRLQIVVEDVTALRALEARLQRAQRWEAAFRSTVGVAADLRAVITDARSEIGTVVTDESLPSDLVGKIASLQQITARAEGLTAQLLAYGGRQTRTERRLDASAVVAGIEAVLRRTIPDHVSLAFALASDLTSIEGDAGQLEDAVVRVTQAAADALPVGGRVTVATSNVYVDSSSAASAEAAPGSYVVVSVEASGWGLEPRRSDERSAWATAVDAAAAAFERMGGRLVEPVHTGDSLTFRAYLAQAHVDFTEGEEVTL